MTCMVLYFLLRLNNDLYIQFSLQGLDLRDRRKCSIGYKGSRLNLEIVAVASQFGGLLHLFRRKYRLASAQTYSERRP